MIDTRSHRTVACTCRPYRHGLAATMPARAGASRSTRSAACPRRRPNPRTSGAMGTCTSTPRATCGGESSTSGNPKPQRFSTGERDEKRARKGCGGGRARCGTAAQPRKTFAAGATRTARAACTSTTAPTAAGASPISTGRCGRSMRRLAACAPSRSRPSACASTAWRASTPARRPPPSTRNSRRCAAC